MKYTVEQAGSEHRKMFSDALEILTKKRHDYAGKVDPFGNFRRSEIFGISPWQGAGIRLMDKMSRFIQLASAGGKGEVTDENIRDTIVDILNYAVIMYQLWKEEQ